MLTKNAPVRVKAGPDDGLAEGEFTAYASVFGNKDDYGDVVMPGAFTKDLERWEKSGNPIPLLFGHVMSDPDFNLGEIVTATEDDKGLLVHARLDLENPKATQTYRMLKGRRVNQMSFAYDVIQGGFATRRKNPDDENSDTEEIYELRELKLYEVSVVTIGANQETEILAVKSIPVVGDRLVTEIKAGRVLSAKNESEIRSAHDALTRVLSALDVDEEKARGKPGKSVRPADQGPAVDPVNPSVETSALLDALALDIELSA